MTDPLAHMTPAQKRAMLEELMARKRQAAPAVDFEAAAGLDPGFAPVAPPAPAAPRQVFMTGATGFMGTYLLAELMRTTRADVRCLVRAVDPEHGMMRLREAMRAGGGWDEAWADRLAAEPGDLDRPGFGLAADRFAAIAAEADAVLHNGATINHLHGYELLAPVNVGGTREALRLALTGRPKAFHHVSTLGVFDAAGYAARPEIAEDAPLAHPDGLTYGYVQTKWVAEQMATNARALGLPVTIYRPGIVTGTAAGGPGNIDFFWLTVKACLTFGLAPDVDYMIELVPVDHLASGMIRVLADPARHGHAYNLTHPAATSLHDFFVLCGRMGYAYETVPYKRWVTALRDRCAASDDAQLRAVSAIYSRMVDTGHGLHRFRYGRANTTAALADAAPFPAIDRPLLEVYFGDLVRSGFLPAPR